MSFPSVLSKYPLSYLPQVWGRLSFCKRVLKTVLQDFNVFELRWIAVPHQSSSNLDSFNCSSHANRSSIFQTSVSLIASLWISSLSALYFWMIFLQNSYTICCSPFCPLDYSSSSLEPCTCWISHMLNFIPVLDHSSNLSGSLLSCYPILQPLQSHF